MPAGGLASYREKCGDLDQQTPPFPDCAALARRSVRTKFQWRGRAYPRTDRFSHPSSTHPRVNCVIGNGPPRGPECTTGAGS